MSGTKEILEAALRLDAGERARLLVALSDSLDTADVGPGWEDEIRRRVSELDAGRVAIAYGGRRPEFRRTR